MGAKWHLPGVSEVNFLAETVTNIPAAGGAGNVVSVQQAGFLKKIRGYLDAQIAQTAAGTAPVKSTYGPLGSAIKRLQVLVAGRKPFFSLSGLGLMVYNEIANVDGSVLCPPAYLTGASDAVVAEAAHLTAHTVAGTAAQTYNVKAPFELLFGIPVWMTKLIGMGKDYIPIETAEEVGLWYLQERKTSLTIESEFWPAYVVSGQNAPYNAGATVAATWSATVNQLRWERELYDVPPDTTAWPDQRFIHQVVEFESTISGKAFSFSIPQVGSLLRAIFILLDANGALVEYTDLTNLSLTYGASDKPIDRSGIWFVNDYLHDYTRYPPKGVVVMDFYKAGRQAARLARDTDRVANLAFNGLFSSTTTGTVKIILESLVPQAIEVG